MRVNPIHVLFYALLPGFCAIVCQGLQVDPTTANSYASQELPPSAILVNLTDAAANKGAVCLDGSPAIYYYIKGSGNGSNKWILYLEGGAWCYDLLSCAERAQTYLGSSFINEPAAPQYMLFRGILDENPSANPDFYNWNLVFVRYCDGASFSGDVSEPVQGPFGDQMLYFRGQRIWKSVVDDLLNNRGMNNAQEALLTGCSAGGLSALIHCDSFRAIMPNSTSVKCLSDAGFFLDQMNVDGKYLLREQFSSTVALQNVSSNLQPGCTSTKTSPDELSQCFFPQYFIQYVETPIFIANSAYDSWQLENSLIPFHDWKVANGSWYSCAIQFNNCTDDQLKMLQAFRDEMFSIVGNTMANVLNLGGAFISSARLHCIGLEHWTGGHDSVQINNLTLAAAFGDWYFGRNQTNRIQIDGDFQLSHKHG